VSEAKLTPRQRRFALEYLVDLNGTQAAIRAGYSRKAARQQAVQNLSKPAIKAFVDEALAKREQRLEVRADDVLRELLRISRVDILQAFDEQGALRPLREIPEDVRRAIGGIEVEEQYTDLLQQLLAGQEPGVLDDGAPRPRMALPKKRTAVGRIAKVRFLDKTRALELLGRHLKLFTDVHQVGGKNGEPIVFRIEE
jgi:phage terminase small subunit